MTQALQNIRWEHHSIEAVFHSISHFVDRMWRGKPAPESRVYRAMLQYIDLLAEQLHHLTEARHLFRLLRLRMHLAKELPGSHEADHHAGAEKMRLLQQALLRYAEGGIAYFHPFAIAFRDYAGSYRAHKRCDEEGLFPLVERVLPTDAWHEIDAASGARGDIHASPHTQVDMEVLFVHMLSAKPAPIGAAPKLARVFRPVG